MLKLIAKNKYKVMAFTICLYLLFDVLLHKGQFRILFPQAFDEPGKEVLAPQSKSTLINSSKYWIKGLNTKEKMELLKGNEAGFECDVYFDSAAKSFDIHHDARKDKGYQLDDMMQAYMQKDMQASIWLDIKNMDSSNSAAILQSLILLRDKYRLQHKILVESVHARLLSPFSDSGFYTSCYIPFFNPYKMNSRQIRQRADSIEKEIRGVRINAMSGYYFQIDFLNHYFPRYPVLTWIETTPFSIVNLLFRKKIGNNNSVSIILKP